MRRRGMATDELLIVTIIIVILAAFALPVFLRYARKPVACVEALAATADGRPGVCPVSGKTFGTGDVLECPDPGRHLGRRPRYERGRFVSDLPAVAMPELSTLTRSGEVWDVVGNRIEIRPRFWFRWIAGPLLILFAVGLVIPGVSAFWARDEVKSIRIMIVIWGAGAALFLVWLVPEVAGHRSIEISPAGVVERRVLFGWERTSTSLEKPEGWVLVSRGKVSTVLRVGTREGRRAVAVICSLEESELGFFRRISAGN